ncbi:MAG: GIY-YIG nuclease family protein [Candidatus Omnitrophota bacterium]
MAVAIHMWYVYILVSKRHSGYLYVGFTNNIDRRLTEHNAARSELATAPYHPLKLVGYIALCDEENARVLEQYFKSGSGKAFLKKRLLALKS